MVRQMWGVVRHRAGGLLLLLPAAMFVAVIIAGPYATFHPDLTLAGSPGRFAAVVVRAGRSNARAALWLENLFVLSWVMVVPRLLRSGLQRWAPERRRAFGWWMHMPGIALGAGALGLVVNGLALFGVGKAQPATVLTLAIATLAWSRWLMSLTAVVGLLGLVIGPLLAPIIRPFMLRMGSLLDRFAGSHPLSPLAYAVDDGPPRSTASTPAWPPSDPTIAPTTTDPTIGICVSGGGIRAASVALGTLRRLDALRPDGPSLFVRARWLVAVSGGGYTAGGWQVSSGLDGGGSSARDGLFDADGAWAATIRERRRFLDNGTWSIMGGILQLLARTAVVLGAIMSAAYAIGWGAGLLVGTRAVHPDFPFGDGSAAELLGWRDLLPLRLVVPGAVLVALAGGAVIVAASRPHRRRDRLIRAATVLAGAGALLLLALVAVPIGVVYGRRLLASLPRLGANGGAGVLGALSTIGIVGALTGVIVGQLKRRWMRLGGVLLALAVALFAGKVADTFAWGYQGIWRSWPVPFTNLRCPVLAVAIAWLTIADLIASHRLTLGGVYRKRLAGTFALAGARAGGAAPPLAPLAYGDEPLWPAYRSAPGPELIVAATAHCSAVTFCGLPAFGFTFRASRVTLHDRVDGTDRVDGSASVAAAQYPTGSWWEGYPRGWLISRSMALSGAAFASAMGRQALGTTNALLVALNLRLGAWVPNPRFPEWFADRAAAPRVHLGYLAKELFSRYHPSRDAFVYVADGGHRENLGLVELLRERPALAFCLDASGDRADSFQTLHEAIELARVELAVDVNIDLASLRRGADAPLDSVAVGEIEYPDGTTGVLIYGKSQLSEASTPALLQFGAIDARFPDYSTIDQFLSDAEHLQLIALGEHVGERMVAMFEAGTGKPIATATP